MKDGWRCKECGAVCTSFDMLTAASPFDAEVEIYGCPHCRSIDWFVRLCDEGECREEVTHGLRTPQGYRNVCWEHFRGLEGKGK